MKKYVIVRRRLAYIEYYAGSGHWSRTRDDAIEYTESERRLMNSIIEREGGREEPA